MSRWRSVALFLSLLTAVAGAAPLAAQRAPIFLEADHWAREAVRRLDAAGAAPLASDPALAPLTLEDAYAIFAFAADSAPATRPGERAIADLASGYLNLLRAEADTLGLLAAARGRVGWVAAAGEALAGDGYYHGEDWEGARPVEDVAGPAAAVRAYGHVGDRVAWSLDGGWLADRPTLTGLTIALRAGPLDAWVGRRRLQYGLGRGGGTVLGSGVGEPADLVRRTVAAFDGFGLHAGEPFHLPSHLRLLGPVRIEAVAGRLARSGHVRSPYIAFGRMSLSPVPRFMIGLNRGAIFGGEGNPVTVGRLLGLLVGMHGGEGGEFENQVISILLRGRPPLGPIPLQLYLEWGMDDTAGAIRDMPAIVAGAEIAALPALPALGVGVEYTEFPRSCCGNPIWYRSIFFRGSWADEGRLFAHPVGGHGREWMLSLQFDAPGAGVLVRSEAFTRFRGSENLFAPGRAGRSHGGSVGVELRRESGLGLRVHGSLEHADGWSTRRISAALSHTLLRSGR